MQEKFTFNDYMHIYICIYEIHIYIRIKITHLKIVNNYFFFFFKGSTVVAVRFFSQLYHFRAFNLHILSVPAQHTLSIRCTISAQSKNVHCCD